MTEETIGLILIVAIFALFATIACIVLAKLNRMRKVQDRIMLFFREAGSLDAAMQLAEEHAALQNELRALREELAALQEKQRTCFDRVNIVRYYSAGEKEAKMSYSVGISNANEDGLVITGLHYRSGVNMYFKQVREGVGDFPLSEEEKEAVGRNQVSKVRN